MGTKPKRKQQSKRRQRRTLPPGVGAAFRQTLMWLHSGEPEHLHGTWVEYGGDPDALMNEIRAAVDAWTAAGARETMREGRPLRYTLGQVDKEGRAVPDRDVVTNKVRRLHDKAPSRSFHDITQTVADDLTTQDAVVTTASVRRWCCRAGLRW